MGRKRAKHKRSLRRRGPQREPYSRVLIVCEGSKTEPSYFEEIRSEYKLSTANIEVVSGDGTDPLSIVRTALEKYKIDDDYDYVFAVFDRDSHENYDAAKQLLKQPGGNVEDKLFGIVSWPCFEYWLLLHYEYTSKPYGGESPCRSLLSDLRAHIPGYDKGAGGVFATTRSNVDDAIDRARRRYKDARSVGSLNPSTKVYLLVSLLRHLKAETKRSN